MPIIDWHSHLLPPQFVSFLRARSTGTRITSGSGGEWLHSHKGASPFDAAGLADVDARLAALDLAGIDRQVFCWPSPDSLALDESVPVSRAFNDGAAELIRRHPARFSAFASLPLAGPALAAQELERAHALGLIGAVLPSEAFASLEEAKKLIPLLEVAQAHQSHLFVHPRFVSPLGEPEPLPLEIDYRGARLGGLEVQARVSNAFFTLAFTDLLEPYPDVIFHVVNLGGTVPFLAERLDLFAQRNGIGPVFERLKRVYVDTANMGRARSPLPRRFWAKIAFCSDRISRWRRRNARWNSFTPPVSARIGSPSSSTIRRARQIAGSTHDKRLVMAARSVGGDALGPSVRWVD